MNFVRRLKSERLASVLEETIRQENEGQSLIRIFRALANQGSELITSSVRDKTVRWLWLLNKDFEFLPETFSLAVALLDRFLSLVKAHPKYAKCIGVTAYFLAIKTVEEDENIPSLEELVQVSKCSCTTSDVLRMERIILTKLDWKLHCTTPLAFLQLYCSMAFPSNYSSSRLLEALTSRLEECLCNFIYTQFKGSVLALALMESWLPGWLTVVMKLQNFIQVDFSDLMRCHEILTTQDKFQNLEQVSAVMPCLETIPELQEPEKCLPGQMQVKSMVDAPVTAKCNNCCAATYDQGEPTCMCHNFQNLKPCGLLHVKCQTMPCGLQSHKSCDMQVPPAGASFHTYTIEFQI